MRRPVTSLCTLAALATALVASAAAPAHAQAKKGGMNWVTGTPDMANKVFLRSGMVPAFGNVGWRLDVGEVGVAAHHRSDSPYGFHVIKRLE